MGPVVAARHAVSCRLAGVVAICRPWIILPRRNNVSVKIAAAVTPHEPKPLKRAAQCVVLYCVAGRRRGPVWTRLKSAQRVSFGNGLAERLSARSDLRIDIAEGRLSAVQLNVLWNVVAIHHSRQTCPAAINAHALCAPRFIAAAFIVAPIFRFCRLTAEKSAFASGRSPIYPYT